MALRRARWSAQLFLVAFCGVVPHSGLIHSVSPCCLDIRGAPDGVRRSSTCRLRPEHVRPTTGRHFERAVARQAHPLLNLQKQRQAHPLLNLQKQFSNKNKNKNCKSQSPYDAPQVYPVGRWLLRAGRR